MKQQAEEHRDRADDLPFRDHVNKNDYRSKVEHRRYLRDERGNFSRGLPGGLRDLGERDQLQRAWRDELAGLGQYAVEGRARPHVGELVEEQRPPVGHLDEPLPPLPETP